MVYLHKVDRYLRVNVLSKDTYTVPFVYTFQKDKKSIWPF